MRRINLSQAVALVALLPCVALATPNPNSAVVKERIFNDCGSTVLTSTNLYPASIDISETLQGCVGGFANLHNWRLSEDGATAVAFSNGDGFRLVFDLEMSGAGRGEAGLSVSPWFSQDVDGRFNVRNTDGEVACFGGRLPFYSFTGSHGVVYTGGVIRLQVTYLPNGLAMVDPGTIEYEVEYNASSYSSGPLPFDEGNPAEDPPFGLWGILNEARVGGYVQHFISQAPEGSNLTVNWSNIAYEKFNPPVPTEETSWGRVKQLYR